MATIISHYSTTDILKDYTTDLLHYPRISQAEIQAIIAALPAAEAHVSPPTARALQARQRLVEAHLRLAVYIATHVCPEPLQAILLPDLVQEANLALVSAVEHYDWEAGGNITTYIFAWIRGSVRKALASRHFIKTRYETRKRAETLGTLDTFYATLQPVSLDRLLDETDDDGGTFLEILESPSSAYPSQHDEWKRDQVYWLLSYLSPRAQTILQLRYGLSSDDNQRPHSIHEIACVLGISRDRVSSTLTDALKRLRAFVNGQASLGRRGGKVCISLSQRD